jgi:aminopeptidase YwaD
MKKFYQDLCKEILHTLCVEIQDRSVGSPGNRQATRYFEEMIAGFGWETRRSEFSALDWEDRGAELKTEEGCSWEVFVSPYSRGASLQEELVVVTDMQDLKEKHLKGKIVLLLGNIAGEQIMPKHFVFFNPKEHQELVSALEEKAPAALITATGRNPSLAGGLYPFPMFEDGDFLIPSVYMTDQEGEKLQAYEGKRVTLQANSVLKPGKGAQLTASKGSPDRERIVISAHIDAKKGTPGAIDNATGVAILLLLANMLKDHQGPNSLEIVPFNGEDYYAASGEMLYLAENEGRFDQIGLNINVDGVGYKQGKTGVSSYNLPDDWITSIDTVLRGYAGLKSSSPWYQGDHTIFLQQGVPALAVTSVFFQENPEVPLITHTPQDDLSMVNLDRVVETAYALEELIGTLAV